MCPCVPILRRQQRPVYPIGHGDVFVTPEMFRRKRLRVRRNAFPLRPRPMRCTVFQGSILLCQSGFSRSAHEGKNGSYRVLRRRRGMGCGGRRSMPGTGKRTARETGRAAHRPNGQIGRERQLPPALWFSAAQRRGVRRAQIDARGGKAHCEGDRPGRTPAQRTDRAREAASSRAVVFGGAEARRTASADRCQGRESAPRGRQAGLHTGPTDR